MSRFYTHDGSWRTTEPSWRVLLAQAENVRGAPSVEMQYAMRGTTNPAIHLTPGRRLVMPEPPRPRTPGDPQSASAAAAAYVKTNFKDQKRTTGFANETLCHASRGDGGVAYGSGVDAGDEAGYITGFRTCTWGGDAAPVYERRHPMRLIAYYNASRYITGAMARYVLAGHEVDSTDEQQRARRHARMHRMHRHGGAA